MKLKRPDAVTALGIGAVLFVLEWVYLFHSGLAMTDEELPEMIAALKAAGNDNGGSAKEGE